jgi:hypothetical protein
LLNNISQLPITVLCATALVSSNVSWSILDWNQFSNLSCFFMYWILTNAESSSTTHHCISGE